MDGKTAAAARDQFMNHEADAAAAAAADGDPPTAPTVGDDGC